MLAYQAQGKDIDIEYAAKYLRGAGIVDENGEFTEPYRSED